jgi:hypothetical protein
LASVPLADGLTLYPLRSTTRLFPGSAARLNNYALEISEEGVVALLRTHDYHSSVDWFTNVRLFTEFGPRDYAMQFKLVGGLKLYNSIRTSWKPDRPSDAGHSQSGDEP